MPFLIENLADSLRISIRDGQHITATRQYHAYELDTSSGDNMSTLAQVFNFAPSPGLPGLQDGITVRIPGTTTARSIFPNTYDATPYADNEAVIVVGYAEMDLSIPDSGTFGLCTVSGGTTLRQVETEFDFGNLELPFENREAISVQYDAANDVPGAAAPVQGGRVPVFMPDSSVTFTRYERTYPGGRSRIYAGNTNADDYEGCPPNSLLMWSVTFEQIASGLWQTAYTMCFDPYNKWRQYLRYQNSDGTFPKLTAAKIANSNGIKEITTQNQVNFTSLDLVVA